ncbi:MAG: YeeE/YedE family protein [Campylobacteraceae bacterium]|nr:YeeE/YedE family protein [Campylobacteraceae bacterium]MBT3882460.1 YeeE/YedE family protein [Campylobacteraceae bacterium]MBT4030883.1 YeeE/YedE family protein [Campylobacteraceae bacterium]MBT4179470.1 YeeE/YedE family protein [Campylobacteraceae bacterium]MBT4572882.1 YeeE/YedE family protein [Campylobacteraceae bacterium]
MNYEIFEIVNIVAMTIGITFGAIAQKTQFCFNGAIKDYILLGSTRRASSVIIAMISAILFTYTVNIIYDLDLTETVWFNENINYFTIVIGGCLFGIGMMLADGCSSRNIIKLSQGDARSFITLLFIAMFAYLSTDGILQSMIHSLTSNSILIDISQKIEKIQLNIFVILFLLCIILYKLVTRIDRVFVLKDGVIVGLLIAIGWYITGVYGAQTLELDTRYVYLTSITFVGPLSHTLEIVTNYNNTNLDFGISVIIGMFIGAFTMSRFNTKYSFGCTSNIKTNKILNNIIGGSLMGIGGTMSIGCTVGQGLTGLSTLAFASVVAILSIFISAYLMGKYLHSKQELPMCFVFEWDK